MRNTYLRRGFFSRLTWGFFVVGLLFFTAPSYAEEIQVYSADPPSAEQGTFDLEVTVVGENFGADSEVDFFVADTADPGGIKVKDVKLKNPKILKVTIDVDPEAQTELEFDILVRSSGRTGKGTELFRVLQKILPNPNVEWVVEIPDEDMAEGNCIQHLFPNQTSADCNLFAPGNIEETPEWVTFSNSGGNGVHVQPYVDESTGLPATRFALTVGEPESIGFRDLGFDGCRSYCLHGGEGPCTCRVFPGSDGIDCCYVDCCQPGDPYCGAQGYQNMKDFMVGSLHPTAGYDYFFLWFNVYEDIDLLEDGVHEVGDAHLGRLNLVNTVEVMEDGDEFDHNVVAAYWIPLEDVVVERSGEEWTVTVNQCGMAGVDGCPGSKYVDSQTNRPIVFWETYYQGVWVEEERGKSGKFSPSLDSEYRWAVGTGAAFKFVTKWKRITKQ